MEKEIKEQKRLVLERVPPGDRWTFSKGAAPITQSVIFPTLTDALEGWYQRNGDTQFYMDARKGTVEVVTTLEVEKPQKRFSLYGED